MLRFALAGNPNSGKTTLFNELTGSTAHVGNWPGVTVDKKEGVYKKLDENINIIDLPGIYSLSPYTPEEVISRNYILDENPDCIINIVDATNLERNLYLTTQLLEIDVPMVVALNMIDVVEKNNETIDIKTLEEKLGVSVVAISASKNINILELMQKAYEASKNKRIAHSVLENTKIMHLINDCKIAFDAIKVAHPLFHAIKLVESDELEVNNHKELVHIVDEYKENFKDETFGSDFEAIIADARYKFISTEFEKVKTNTFDNEVVDNKNKKTKSDKIDRVLTNRWVGIPIFLIILFLIFHLTFSENLFWLGGLIHTDSFANSEFFAGAIWHEGGINSPGVMLQSLLIGFTDWLSSLASNGLASANAAPWVSGLLVDGILAGVFAVLSFLPQILLLFLFFSLLEDSGYMARIAFIMDRIFRRFGLSGRAFMPMIMGFGCSIPAMINTRTLADDKERCATIRVIPFFSCGAKLPILTAIAGGIVSYFKIGNADLITFSMYLLGIMVAILTVLLMRNTSMRGKVAPFIMELPQYHMPRFKPLMIHLWDKLKHFVKKAFTIILASTIVIWFLQSFTANLKYIEQANPNEIADQEFETIATEDEAYITILLSYEDLEAYDEENNLQIAFADVISYYNEADEADQESIKYDLLDPVLLASYDAYVEEISAPDYKDQNDSILAHFGTALTPIFTPMGFGSQLSESGWIFPVSAVTGLIAKENVIATFQVLSQASSKAEIEAASTDEDKTMAYLTLYNIVLDEDGINAANATIKATNINVAGLIAFIAFNMLTIPCFAAVATAKAELPAKAFRRTLLFWLITSYTVASMIYLIGTFVWTISIFAVLLTALICSIVYYNKKHPLGA